MTGLRKAGKYRRRAGSRGWKRTAGCAAALVLLCLAAFPTRALAGGSITGISLKIEADLRAGEPCDEDAVTVTSRSVRYEVESVEILNGTGVWGTMDTPRIAVVLQAEEGYVFQVSRRSVRIDGGEYVSGGSLFPEDEEGGNREYRMIIRLPSLRYRVGEISEARWDSLTVGKWSGASNAVRYEVRLYRDGISVGTAQTVPGTEFDFGNLMRTAGNYSYQVRGINAFNSHVKSPWVSSGESRIDEGAAGQIRQQYGSPAEQGQNAAGPGQEAVGPGQNVSGSGQNAAGPGQKPWAGQSGQDGYGWILDGGGWWYRNADGSYPAGNWQMIDGKWYFFDSKGYMVTGWIEWNGKSYYCDPQSGQMLVSTIVPDGLGLRVDSTGAMLE